MIFPRVHFQTFVGGGCHRRSMLCDEAKQNFEITQRSFGSSHFARALRRGDARLGHHTAELRLKPLCMCTARRGCTTLKSHCAATKVSCLECTHAYLTCKGCSATFRPRCGIPVWKRGPGTMLGHLHDVTDLGFGFTA